MKRVIVCLCVVAVFSFCLVQVAQADELSELKKQTKVMQRQMKEMQRKIEKLEAERPRKLKKRIKVMQKQMEEMQKKIEKLEAERARRIETPEEMEERVIALEEKAKKPYEGGLLTLKGEKWEIGGELELEFVDTQDDDAISEPEPHFQIDKFVLKPKVHFTDEVTLKADLEFTQDGAGVTVAVLEFSDIPLNSKLKIGLDSRFITPSRKTERYPLAGTAFWRDEEIGITLSTEHKPFYGMLSLSQGLEIGSKQVGEDSSYKMLHDNTRTSNYGGIKEVGVGLGLKNELGSKIGEVDILGFGYHNELSDADIDELKSELSNYTSNDDDQYRVGVNLDYSLGDFNFFAQYINTRDGDLDRYAWYIQPSYKVQLPSGWKYCNDHTFLVRYGEYNLDNTKSFSKPATWDREELTFAIMTEVMKNIKLKTEYSINEEKTGNGRVNNDELVMQLEVKF